MMVVSTCSLSQHEKINQLTKDSVRNGKWIEYDANGRIYSISFYKATKRKLSPEELFTLNYPFGRVNEFDSTIHRAIRVGKWTFFWPNGTIKETTHYTVEGSVIMHDKYKYDKDWNLKFIERWNRTNKGPTFITSGRDSIELSHIRFHEIGVVDEWIELKTKARNLSGRDVEITILPNPALSIQQTRRILEMGDSSEIAIKLKIQSGRINEKITMRSDDWILNLKLLGFGYHITVTDFKNDHTKVLPGKFYYYRNSEYYEMQILSNKKRARSSYIPLSKQMVDIELKKGTYKLTIKGASGEKTTNIEIE